MAARGGLVWLRAAPPVLTNPRRPLEANLVAALCKDRTGVFRAPLSPKSKKSEARIRRNSSSMRVSGIHEVFRVDAANQSPDYHAYRYAPWVMLHLIVFHEETAFYPYLFHLSCFTYLFHEGDILQPHEFASFWDHRAPFLWTERTSHTSMSPFLVSPNSPPRKSTQERLKRKTGLTVHRLTRYPQRFLGFGVVGALNFRYLKRGGVELCLTLVGIGSGVSGRPENFASLLYR